MAASPSSTASSTEPRPTVGLGLDVADGSIGEVWSGLFGGDAHGFDGQGVLFDCLIEVVFLSGLRPTFVQSVALFFEGFRSLHGRFVYNLRLYVLQVHQYYSGSNYAPWNWKHFGK